jgi:class 3 adenylate cyclase/predicted ATPase
MPCARCRAESPAGTKFCGQCGAPLASGCPSCGATNPPGNKFCGQCGTPFANAAEPRFASPESYTPRHLAEKILTSKTALEGERKQVTVLFADLKGSMELLADRDPEEARKLLDPVLERMMEVIHRYEGTVNQVMGDGIMALFGAPLAHEDHAVRACYAAHDMQAAMRRYTEQVRHTQGVEVQIRVGLNSGDVVVRAIGSDLRMDYTAVGQTTHLAARMEQLATPGTIRLTAETLRLAEGYIEVKPLGPVPVKGLEAPIEVYEMVGAGPRRSRLHAAAARGLTRFVGRETELDALRQALTRTAAGHGQVVAIVGEPGVGKSRLVWEVTHSHRVHGWLVLQAGSVSYGKATSYLPVIDLLKGYFAIEDRDGPRAVQEKLTGKLLTLDRAQEGSLSALLSLLDVPTDDLQWAALDPPQRRRRTLDAVKRLLLRESQAQPLLVVFEDLHWIDSETQALLDGLVESLPATRLLLLVNYRPEYQHPWGSRTYYTQLRLDPLLPDTAENLLGSLLGSDAGLEPLTRGLLARAEGNPFFLEESVRALTETGALVGERGAYRLTRAVEHLEIPATIQAILAARIDRGSPEDKRLLQAAAVVGKDVPMPLLLAIAEAPEDEVHAGLGRLHAGEFLYETSLFPELEYTFKHALTHEVAYGSILHERRRTLHARIVETIERSYAARLSEQVERLAHHAVCGALWEKAVRYLHQAGVKAAARSANREAVELLGHALTILAQLPESRDTLREALDIRIALGPALTTIKGPTDPEVEASYTRAQELCARLDEDNSRLFPVVWGLWYVNIQRGQYRTAKELGDRLLGVAHRSQDPALLLAAHHTLWATLTSMGELASARTHLEEGLTLYDPQQHRSHALRYGGHDPGVCCRYHWAGLLWLLGYPDQALTRAREALSLARELSHPLTSVLAHYEAACLHYRRGEHRAAAENAEIAVTVATAQESLPWAAYGSMLLARLMVEQGRRDEGIAQLQRGLAAARAAGRGAGSRASFSLCLLVEAYSKVGQPENGLEVLSVLVAEGNIAFAPEWYRLKGELLLAKAAGAAADAEVYFRRAIEVARARQMKSLELRAATSLSRFLSRQGRRDEGRRMLAEVYDAFTEGFDTRDLKEAKALLEQQ